MADAPAASLPYHEPDVVIILVLTSFLLLLNIVNAALDQILYCGLLGQVLIGIAWGSPGAAWLSTHVEEVVVQLGYLGLILLVFEGGLSTSFTLLKANLFLSSAVAVTGIAIPIALSFSLQGLLGATPLQAFAAGAALSSTSLGTTFTVLASSGLTTTRLGVVLTSAAMMDDVVGLVMVQVISNLDSTVRPVTLVRPILVSLAFAIVVPIICQLVVRPTTVAMNTYRGSHPFTVISKVLRLRHTAFALHTLLLISLIAAANFAGTSNLFAAYSAGAIISWWDTEVSHPQVAQDRAVDEKSGQTKAPVDDNPAALVPGHPPADVIDGPHNVGEGASRRCASMASSVSSSEETLTSGPAIYGRYYQQVVSKILQPFFFASIGFSIPITRMFTGSIVWRGIVYTFLMIFGKLVCGLWLVRFSKAPGRYSFCRIMSKIRFPSFPHLWGKNRKPDSDQPRATPTEGGHSSNPTSSVAHLDPSTPPKPVSLHPPVILALAMVARGEIGFLVSAVAESKGVFSSSKSAVSRSESDIFLAVTWAIVLCTIIGPLGVGLSVRRVRALEERKDREQDGAGRDVLGVWGVR
ncbi:Sodium/hydrogen exchanger family-domain-containing protein [Clohesyomyces aquaticus]|uniref:Sodium/hydrogen exchanger family-domain-containing protein n=1 Tax=Clohesyomyces aquaticus TaxID=1231657 RepID=A0A1Y2A581_9PLEO|nr:Sodium/hydrogen exchanger family-domain-containing protein [Clohesyomyces aquaticus]